MITIKAPTHFVLSQSIFLYLLLNNTCCCGNLRLLRDCSYYSYSRPRYTGVRSGPVLQLWKLELKLNNKNFKSRSLS